MVQLRVDVLLIVGIAAILLAVIIASALIISRIRRTTRDLQAALRTASRQPAPLIPANGGPARQGGPFWQKQQEVYAALYARYRRAADAALPRPEHAPDFSLFSRDELLRYLARRKVREREASDAIAALDRGDTFAMARLMTRLHQRVDQRDASLALRRATAFEELNELYLSDRVRPAVATLRQRLTPAADPVGQPNGERRQATAPARGSEREIRDALSSLQRVMREELAGEQPLPPSSAPARLGVPAEEPVARTVHVERVERK